MPEASSILVPPAEELAQRILTGEEISDDVLIEFLAAADGKLASERKIKEKPGANEEVDFY